MNNSIKEKIEKIISKNLRDGGLYSITFLTNDLFELFQLTEQEKNREFSEFLANTSIIANDISKLSLMIMETINDKDDFEKLQHIANLISGINNSLQSFADLIGEKIKELESKK